MLKPSEFKPHTETDASDRLAAIELEVEKRLSAGYLTVDGGRSGWLMVDIFEVAKRYRAIGWEVSTSGRHTFTFAIPAP